MMRTLLTEGPLEEVGLSAVLTNAAERKDFIAIELRDFRDLPVGAIFLKSDQVVHVEPAVPNARAAFQALMNSDDLRSYRVYQLDERASYARVDSLARLLGEEDLREETSPGFRMPERNDEDAGRTSQVSPIPPARQSGRHRSVTPVVTPAVSERPAPMNENLGHVIVICSPKGGVGKTTVSLNLAVALARQHRPVILVDVDPNGDIASALDAHARIERGVYDVLAGDAVLEDVLRGSALPNLQILPARGGATPMASLEPEAAQARLPALLQRLARPGTLVLVDCPAGMFGVTKTAMQHSTHALGVLQAESIASRSFDMLLRAMRGDPRSPELIGVIVNMFVAQSQPAFEAFKKVGQDRGYRTFDTPVPRSEVISRAAMQGQPTGGAIGAIFAALGEEIVARLGISKPRQITEEPFLT